MNDLPTARFTERAGAYAANRPGYPPAALDALLEGLGPPEHLTIADIGAGTGIAARLLAERGATVLAVEPNHSMAEQAEPDPRIEWIDGTGEDTHLPAKSVDIAGAFQAFHWFEAQTAVEEFKRISRRRIALVQYERDESHAFAAAYGELVRRFAIEDIEQRRAQALTTFAQLAGASCKRSEHSYEQLLDLQQQLGRMESTSYLPHGGAKAEELRREAVALFERFAEGGRVSLTMVCYVLYADA
ncbi:MAG TPA: class I SAM-dependent methyltransferase [Candidatus Rubrimentiphilum sp.]|nr:class I SAM-dependent methyltransferase [Candidatus Rubrimentiphilum sp.]